MEFKNGPPPPPPPQPYRTLLQTELHSPLNARLLLFPLMIYYDMQPYNPIIHASRYHNYIDQHTQQCFHRK